MGGGGIGAKFDAETTRTWLSVDEIGPQGTYFHIMSVNGLVDVVFKDI